MPNAGAAHLSMTLKLRGPCQTLIGSRTAGLDALRLAALRIGAGEWDRAVVCAGEEHDPLVERCLAELGLPMTTAAGAVTLVLESPSAARERGATPRACVGPGGQIAAPGDPRRHRQRLAQLLHDSPADAALITTPLGGIDHPTWLSRVEAAALRRAAGPRQATTFSPGVAETFSGTGLLAIAHAIEQAPDSGVQTVLNGDPHGLHTVLSIAPA